MLWDQSMSRRFDLGFECFDERLYSRWQVKAPLLRRLAEVNGDLVITIYRDGEPIRQRRSIHRRTTLLREAASLCYGFPPAVGRGNP